jgi:hypothetical protein
MTTKDYIFSEGERIYLKGYTDGLKAMIDLEHTCKTENRPSDGGKTDKGMFIPESPSEAERALNKRVDQNETEIDMLWNEIDRLKERMPKEWL